MRTAAVTGGGELCGVMAKALAELGVNMSIFGIRREPAAFNNIIVDIGRK